MSKDFQYILRYYLPVQPEFDEEFTKKRFDELLEVCDKAKIESVMFFVALAESSYYLPEKVELTRKWVKQMLPYIEKIRQKGISYQLNFQNLLGSHPFGYVDYNDYDYEHLVDQNGIETPIGCPIGKKFIEYSQERLRLWASTKPDVIWIDDDFSMHNHGGPTLAGLEGKPDNYDDFYCFCDAHIKLFNEKHGTNYNREQLVEQMQRGDKVTWERTAYQEFISEQMNITASWIEQVVHKESPTTRLAMMTSVPDVHATEHRDWDKFLKSLCGKYPPILRPTFGPYSEPVPREFVISYWIYSQLKANLRNGFNGEVICYPEIENSRFTRWVKSGAGTGLQLSLSAFMGSTGITLSLYDLEGGAFFDEPLFTQVLTEEKEHLSKILTLNLKDAKEMGVIIPTSCDSGMRYVNFKERAEFGEMSGEHRYIQGMLLKMGIPCRYLAPSEITEGVVALDDYCAGYLSDQEIMNILSKGVLIDYGAADVLIKRGFGEYIGIKSLTERKSMVMAEILNMNRKDGTYIRVPSRVPAQHWAKAELLDGVTQLSRFYAADGEKTDGFIMYENKLGGKVATYLAKRDFGAGFFTHYRVKLWKDTLAKLDSNLPRLDCGSYSLFAVSSKEDKKFYFVANLASDTVKEFAINGQTINEELCVYQSAIFVEENGKLSLFAKSRKN